MVTGSPFRHNLIFKDADGRLIEVSLRIDPSSATTPPGDWIFTLPWDGFLVRVSMAS